MLIEPQYLPMLRTASMNDAHFEEMQLINQLSAALQNSDIETINETFGRLLEHTREHYRHEEAMMLEKKFPPYPAHKEEHDASLKEMEEAATNFKDTQNVEAARKYVTETLAPWFLTHTETMDQVTSLFLENSEAHMPYWEQLIPRNK
jgi:hemerythrin